MNGKHNITFYVMLCVLLICKQIFAICPPNSMSSSEGICECYAGYESLEISASVCEECGSGYYKTSVGNQKCTECASKNSNSGTGSTVPCIPCPLGESMITKQKNPSQCIPCPFEFGKIVEMLNLNYIHDLEKKRNKWFLFYWKTLLDNIFSVEDILASLEIQEQSEHDKKTWMNNAKGKNILSIEYYIDTTICENEIVISDISELLVARKICQVGEYARLVRADLDTECFSCESGQYQSEANVLAASNHFIGRILQMKCRNVSICNDGFWDATGINIHTKGRNINSNCENDFDIDLISLGLYPVRQENDQNTFLYSEHRHIKFASYSECTATDFQLKIKCMIPNSCVHTLHEVWSRGELRLPLLENAGKSGSCYLSCNIGYFVDSIGKCLPCASGTYKNTTSDLDTCSVCEAGKISSSPQSTVCIECEMGSFSYEYQKCESCCEIEKQYKVGDLCHKPNHYIEYNDCSEKRTEINIKPCPQNFNDNPTSVASLTSDIVLWTELGETSCNTPVVCDVRQLLDLSGVCVQRCWYEDQYYDVEQERCASCNSDFAYFEKTCGNVIGLYLEDSCSKNFNQNTLCANCPLNSQMFQELDIASIDMTASNFEKRCKMRCIPPNIRGGSVWFYKSIKQVAIIMKKTEQAIRDALRLVVDEESITDMCIRTEIDSSYSCISGNTELFTMYDNIIKVNTSEPTENTWPTVLCKHDNKKCMDISNSVLLMNNEYSHTISAEDEYRCHCDVGFYGNYDITSKLLQCFRCDALRETSIPGTNDIQGCYCKPGFFRNQDSQVCEECSPPENSYCDGKIDENLISAYVYDSIKLQEKLASMSHLKGKVACPIHTNIQKRFAWTSADCVIKSNMRYVDELKIFVPCDEEPYISEQITNWLPPLDTMCNRQCVGPGAILMHNGTCRCDVSSGFELRGQNCKCRSGYYTNNEICYICPENWFCPDGIKRQPCNVDSISSVGSISDSDCRCYAGYYPVSDSQTSNRCTRCLPDFKCPMGEKKKCNNFEICKNYKVSESIICPVATSRDQNYLILQKPTNNFFDITGDQLITNTKGIPNIMLEDLVYDKSFYSNLKDFTKNVKMNYVGIFSTFRFLCEGGYSITINKTQTIHDKNKHLFRNAFYCSNGHGLYPRYLINTIDSVIPLNMMGSNGFISMTYKDPKLYLGNIESHLTWDVFLQCSPNKNKEFPIHSLDMSSEIGMCETCDTENGEFLKLQVLNRYYDSKISQNQNYMFETTYINMDAASQLVWSSEIQKNNERIFTLLKITNAIPTTMGKANSALMYTDIYTTTQNLESPTEVQRITKKIFTYQNYAAKIDKHVFYLYLPTAGFRIDYNRVLIIGMCSFESPDSLSIAFLRLDDDIVGNTVVKNCINCCREDLISESNIFAHIDVGCGILYVMTNSGVHIKRLDDSILHMTDNIVQDQNSESQFEFLSHNSALTTNLITILQLQAVSNSAFDSHLHRLNSNSNKFETMQIFYILHQYQIEGITYNSISEQKIIHDTDFGSFDENKIYNRGDVLNTNRLLIRNHDVVPLLKLQILSKYYTGVDTTSPIFSLDLINFYVINNRKVHYDSAKQETSKKLDIILLHTQEQKSENNLKELIVSLARVEENNVDIILLSTIASHTTRNILSFFYSIIPFYNSDTNTNQIFAKSAIVVISEDISLDKGNTEFIITNFTCSACHTDNHIYNRELGKCVCQTGTVPVCVPCGLDCDSNTFVIDPSPEQCISGDSLVNTQTIQKYNLICMACGASIYCEDGTVNGVHECPKQKPYTMKTYSTSINDCSCAEGTIDVHKTRYVKSFTNVSTQIHASNFLVSKSIILDESCTQCTDDELCSPIYTQNGNVIKCANNTNSFISYTRNPITNILHITQTCACFDGFYATYQDAHSYTLEYNPLKYNTLWPITTILNQSTIFSKRIFYVKNEVCQSCEDGYYCEKSKKKTCSVNSNSILPRSKKSDCVCKPGFDYLTCGVCPLNTLCYGYKNVPISIACRMINNKYTQYCPCDRGSILISVGVLSWQCVSCPQNFYCSGFQNMTGILPPDIMYPTRCPEDSRSSKGSSKVQECICKPGMYQHHGKCEVCGIGYYCDPFSVQRNKCPPHTSTFTNTSTKQTDCRCDMGNMQIFQNYDTCVCRSGWRINTHGYMPGVSDKCVRCVGFPALTTNYLNSSLCVCAPGWFETSRYNLKLLEKYNYTTQANDHPFSTEHRHLEKNYINKYSQELITSTNDMITPNTVQCIPCPPNFICHGSNTPPKPFTRIDTPNNEENKDIAMYTFLPAMISSSDWYVSCPNSSHISHRHQKSVGLSSCFQMAKTWQVSVGRLASWFKFTLPCMLYVKTTTKNVNILSNIVNINSTFYSREIFADSAYTPDIHYASLSPDFSDAYFFLFEMDVLSFLPEYSETLNKNRHKLIQSLTEIDQGTGVAFVVFMPILWACIVQQKLILYENITKPVAIIPGILENTLTKQITERAITLILQILKINTTRPEFIFQVAAKQFLSVQTVNDLPASTIMYAHNNICDSFYNMEYIHDCKVHYPGLMMSTYEFKNTNFNIFLTSDELINGLFWKDKLPSTLEIFISQRDMYFPTTKIPCPSKTVSGALIHISDITRTCTTCPFNMYYNGIYCEMCMLEKGDTCESLSSKTLITKYCAYSWDNVCVPATTYE